MQPPVESWLNIIYIHNYLSGESMNTIYVGWDSREDIAYQVCEHSIYRRTYPQFVTVKPLKQSDLRDRKLYLREVD